MFGILGIFGCVIGVCAVVGAAVAVGGTIFSIYNAEQQKAAAEKKAEADKEAQAKQENMLNHDKLVQKKQVAQNLLKTSQAIGDAIAGAQLQRKHALQEAYKVRSEAASEATKNRKSAI